MKKRFAAFFLAVVTCATFAAAQNCNTSVDLAAFVDCRVRTLTEARLKAADTTKQTEAPSATQNSTSLVDRSSAADLLGMALDLAGLTSKSKEPNTTNTTVTTTAYALLAAATHNDPLNPAYYAANLNARRLSFSLGQEFPDNSKTTGAAGSNIYGFKYLIIAKRDVSDPANQKLLTALAASLAAASPTYANIVADIQNYLFTHFGSGQSLADFIKNHLASNFAATLAQLDTGDFNAIDKFITSRLDAEVNLRTVSRSTVSKILNAPQFSFGFTSRVGKNNSGNLYRAELIFDKGVYKQLQFTANASYEYGDSQLVGKDQRGGRVALQFEQPLNGFGALPSKTPTTLNFSGEGKWSENVSPTYQAQAKLTLSLLSGLQLPISITYASQTELIKEADVRGHIGITFDVSKLARAFGGSNP